MRLGMAIGLVSAALVASLGITASQFAGEDLPPVPAVEAPSPSSTAPVTTTTTAPPPPEVVTMAFTGDILIHSPVAGRAAENGAATGVAYDFRPMFAAVRPLLSAADLAICHLEVPLSADNSFISSYPSFSAPREVADALPTAGYDGCSTASNHSIDQGGPGVVATLDNLDRVAIEHDGTARGPQEAQEPTLYEVQPDLTVAHISAAYGFNGYLPDTPWRVQSLDPAQIIAEAQRARDLGADLVVASLHWGIEYQHDPTADQRALATRLARSGAIDLIVGHHAHVVQPVERIAGVPVIFGLGNSVSNQSSACCALGTEDGAIAHVRAVRPPGRRRFQLEVTITPTWVEPGTYVIRPVPQSLADPALAAVHGALQASQDRTMSVMNASGVAPLRQPLPAPP